MISPGLFRLVLATLVVISHFSPVGLGTVAVHLFFVLSGFWIYRMFRDKYMLAANPGLVFVASRLMRLLPMFILFNGLAIILHGALRDDVASAMRLDDVFSNMLIVGYASLPVKPMIPAWSLDIETQFYLMFPLVFLMIRAANQYAWSMLVVALAAGGAYFALYLNGEYGNNVLPYLGFFLLGALSAQLGWRPPNWLVYGSLLIALAGLAVLLAVPALQGFLVHNLDPAEIAWNPTLNFLLGLLLAPFALSSVYRRSTRTDRLLGDMSYVVYCSHWLAVLIRGYYLVDMTRFQKVPLVFGLIVATYLVSLVVLLYVDRPISRWRERWVERHLSRAPAHAVVPK